METLIVASPEQLQQYITAAVKEALKGSNNSPDPVSVEDDELLTRTKAKEILGVSYPTLRAWTDDGKLKAYRIGTRIRYKRSEVYAALTVIQPSNIAA